MIISFEIDFNYILRNICHGHYTAKQSNGTWKEDKEEVVFTFIESVTDPGQNREQLRQNSFFDDQVQSTVLPPLMMLDISDQVSNKVDSSLDEKQTLGEPDKRVEEIKSTILYSVLDLRKTNFPYDVNDNEDEIITTTETIGEQSMLQIFKKPLEIIKMTKRTDDKSNTTNSRANSKVTGTSPEIPIGLSFAKGELERLTKDIIRKNKSKENEDESSKDVYRDENNLLQHNKDIDRTEISLSSVKNATNNSSVHKPEEESKKEMEAISLKQIINKK